MLKVFAILLLSFLNVSAVDISCDAAKVYKPFAPPPAVTTTTPATVPGLREETEKYYYICISDKGDAIKKTCPPGLDFVESLLGCSYGSSSTTPPATLECTEEGEIFPVEGDCTQCQVCTAATGPPGDAAACTDEEGPLIYNKFLDKFVPVPAGVTADCSVWEEAPLPDCMTDAEVYGEQNIGIPGNCEIFYQCFEGIRVKNTCPSGYLYDTMSQACRLDYEVQCSGSPSVDSNLKDICVGKTGTFVTDPNYCKGYYYCIDDKTPYWGYCADNKYFSNGFCVSTRPGNCICEDADYSLSPNGVYFAPHSDPKNFYICKKGEAPVLKTCPAGSFDEAKQECG